MVTSGASARKPRDPRLNRLGYWPAVVMLFLLVWFELALRVVPASPRALGILTLVYALVQVGMGAWLGEGWYRGGDLFAAITALASTISPIAISRDEDGFVRLKLGFRPARFLPQGRGREALITLWLAGVLADGVRVTPIWRFVSDATAGFTSSMGQVGAVNLGDLLLDSSEIVATWMAFAAFFLGVLIPRRPAGSPPAGRCRQGGGTFADPDRPRLPAGPQPDPDPGVRATHGLWGWDRRRRGNPAAAKCPSAQPGRRLLGPGERDRAGPRNRGGDGPRPPP